MRRRKPTQTTQVNVRLDTELVRQLEMRAKERRTTLSEEIRERIIGSLDPKPEPSLWGFLDAFGHRVRDIIEHGARKDIEAAKDIETAWGHLHQYRRAAHYDSFTPDSFRPNSHRQRGPRSPRSLAGHHGRCQGKAACIW